MISVDERLGRRFSKGSKDKNLRKIRQVLNGDRHTLPPSFFKADDEGRVSLDRLQTADAVRFLTSLAQGLDPKFRGWAVLSVDKLRDHEFGVAESPTDENPYHCDILLPASSGYGSRLTYVQALTACIVDYQSPITERNQ